MVISSPAFTHVDKTDRKLAHSPVKFPARSISHFVMNIIMAETGSTVKVVSSPSKFPAIRYGVSWACIASMSSIISVKFAKAYDIINF